MIAQIRSSSAIDPKGSGVVSANQVRQLAHESSYLCIVLPACVAETHRS
jgi:hypothetical protein